LFPFISTIQWWNCCFHLSLSAVKRNVRWITFGFLNFDFNEKFKWNSFAFKLVIRNLLHIGILEVKKEKFYTMRLMIDLFTFHSVELLHTKLRFQRFWPSFVSHKCSPIKISILIPNIIACICQDTTLNTKKHTYESTTRAYLN
jgi:hypothetical protein